jgi:5'-nucleotidase
MRILVDMDGVLADFEGHLMTQWRSLYPNSFHMRPEERKDFYISDYFPEEERQKVLDLMYAREFFANLPTIPGGKEALTEMRALGWQVWLCSSPLIQNRTGASEKYDWIEQHLGQEWIGDLILATDKTLVQGDILIDDRPVIEGAYKPSWEHVLYDQVYNREQTGKRRLTWANWKSVLIP